MSEAIKKSVERKLTIYTYLVLSIIGLGAALLLTFSMLSSFKDTLTPQVLLKSNVVAKSVQATIADALKLGIPFDSLVGVEDYLSDVLADNPEIDFIQIKNQQGREYVKYRGASSAGQSNQNIIEETLKHDTLPTITVGLRKSYVNEKLQTMVGDAVIVSFVAFTVGLEIVLFFVVLWIFRPLGTWVQMIEGLKTGTTQKNLPSAISGPFAELIALTSKSLQSLTSSARKVTAVMKGNDWYEPKAYDLRLVLFLFVFSEELLRSFMPIYVKDIALTNTLIAVDIDIALPIMSYMLFAGLGTVFGGGLVERLGIRNAFKWSVLLSTIGLGGLAFATSVAEVVILRSLCAVGYAVATVACQVFMTQTAKTEAERTRGLGTFVAAVTAASLSAAPIGAVIAQLLGLNAAMIFAAVLAALSWFFFTGITIPAFATNQPSSVASTSLGRSFSALLKNHKTCIILISNALSGKLMLAGLMFYLTPLLLLGFNFSQVSIGQFFMLYYVPLTLGNMLLARFTPSPKAKTPIMVMGSLLSGVGVLLLFWFNTPYALAIAIVCLGVGQSAVLALAPALLLSITRAELPEVATSHTLSLVRTFDRIGGILGAALAAIFSLLVDYREATVGIGIVALVLGLGNLGLVLRSKRVK
jgi:MFS family permease